MDVPENIPPRALYVHVPFCVGKCGYCDFYSVVRTRDAVRAYLDGLRRELEMTADERPEAFTTVYVGGGTPTSLEADELRETLDALRAAARLAEPVEFTVEANPGTLTPEKLRLLREHGVNRLSLGAQSFDGRLLRLLGRRHARRDIFDALASARAEGFANLSLDLIFAVPTQTPAGWARDLDQLLALDVPHVSAYSLTYEEDTPLARAVAAGEMQRASEEDELSMYETAIDTLTKAGCEHYEISNFARPGLPRRRPGEPGCRCAHNEVYWANESYLGLGPSAVSYIGGERRRNVASVEGYAGALAAGRPAADFRERLTGEKRARETAVMNLRRTRGLDFAEFSAHTGFDARELFAAELERLAADGFVELAPAGVRLTRPGLMVADSVLSELV